MVFCIVALIVLAIAGIFSASHRQLAKEAFHCVFRMATLRKCDTSFDQKMKMKISGKLMGRSPRTSKFVFKHFTLISWVLFIVTIASLGYTVFSVYNLAVFGTCDPITGDCIFNPGNPNPSCSTNDFNALSDDDPFLGPVDAKVVIVEFSDFQCPACGAAEPAVEQMLSEFDGKVKFVFRDLPLISIHPNALFLAEAANCAIDQGKYWEMHDILYNNQTNLDSASIQGYALKIGLNLEQFNQCLSSRKYVNEINHDIEDARAFGVNATPTFFINGEKFVGVQSIESFRQIINSKLSAS